ncbi:MAG: diguanylate cyclase [Pseudomonadota bacterium]
MRTPGIPAFVSAFIAGLLCLVIPAAQALETIALTGDEAGLSLDGRLQLWHDPSAEASLEDAMAALAGAASLEPGAGSTGLEEGAFWSRFSLRNTTDTPLEVRLEYIDHQLVYLRAFQSDAQGTTFRQLADLSLDKPFTARPVPHHRFVVPAELPPGESADFYVQYGSHQMGFVFPELRIWSPTTLALTQAKELALMAFIVGGLVLMAFMAIIGGAATGARFYYAYALHALASVAVWVTVFGYTHQFLLQENYHWRYMSLTGAVSLFTGLLFAREFLNSRKYLPRMDWLLLFLMLNSVFLFLSALAEQSTLSVISITLALLLYPTVSIAGAIRWFQGAREAAPFTIAWTFLVIGLFLQALRDLGVVEHNLINYYWPAVASYGEMVVILAAMTIRIVDLRKAKETAERARITQLEESQLQLESQVEERTRELAAAKNAAEMEARTDPLTGIHNRRSFMDRGQKMLDRCRREGTPLNLLMLDIDHFKAINDKNGHATGDKALVSFATVVQGFLRERDLFGRIGGEEFAVLFVSEKDTAVDTADRVREQVKALELQSDRGRLQFTTSIGVAHLSDELTLEPFLKKADEALYRAKHDGRDRVVAADEDAYSARPLSAG